MKGDRLGEFEEIVLLAVRQLGADAHGANIQELLAEQAEREVALGAIYTVMDRAQRKGLSESWLGEPTAERGGRAKRHYGLTDEGEEALRRSREVREQLWGTPAPAEP